MQNGDITSTFVIQNLDNINVSMRNEFIDFIDTLLDIPPHTLQ